MGGQRFRRRGRKTLRRTLEQPRQGLRLLAGSESLAILEILVHLDPEKLPACWRDEPAPPETAEIGDVWLSEGSELALALPSVIVPREWNFLLNPKHRAFAGVVKRVRRLDFEPDKRLFPT